MNKFQAATDTFKELAFYYAVTVLVSSGLFTLLEGTALLDSLYWAVTTSTSTGYGDITPKSDLGKVLAMFLMPFSIFFLGPLAVVRLMQRAIHDKNEFSHHEQEAMKADIAEIKRLLENKA